jgi:hypothetical protein
MIYFLVLNTFGSAEAGEIVACATSEEVLKDWYQSQKLENTEVINGYTFTFKEGPIRRNNPLHRWRQCNEDSFGHGWFSEWVQPDEIRDSIYKVDF